MDELKGLFISIIEQAQSIDVAEAEFKRLLIDDPELRAGYRVYCREVGSTEKNGFLDFCEEYLQHQNSAWDSLNDYDE